MRIDPLSRAELAAAIRAEIPANQVLTLELGGLVAEVRCSGPELASELGGYFSEFLHPRSESCDILITAHESPEPEWNLPLAAKEPDPGKTRIKEEWADIPGGRLVRKRLTGMGFLFGEGENVAFGPCLANANQVVNFVNNRHIELRLNQGCLLGHAAGVTHGGRGLCLAGFSGAGKSTLALHVMSRGAVFVSNDRVMVEDAPAGPVMHGVAKQPRINPGTALHNPDLAAIVAEEDRERFLNLAPEELWKLEHKYDALVDQCYGPGRFRLSAPMHALVILNWKRDGGPTTARIVNPADRRDLLPAFIKSPGLFYLPDAGRSANPSEDAYVRLLSRAALIEISGGVDFDRAADACMEYMETGRLSW